jgi:hypothetical protein
MTNVRPLPTLSPNNPDGFHQRRGERIEQKTIEIGEAESLDFITESTLVGCDLHILRGGRSVNLFGCTFERSIFRARRELKNVRFTGMTLRGCTFLGRYVGCGFGNKEPHELGEVRGCDFSQATRFHLCEFLDGADTSSMLWPRWPHIVITDLPRSAGAWRKLDLPEELRIVQEVIADGSARAVTLYLPAETNRAEELRPVFASQSYIVIA